MLFVLLLLFYLVESFHPIRNLDEVFTYNHNHGTNGPSKPTSCQGIHGFNEILSFIYIQ